MNKKYIQALLLICAILVMGIIGGIAGSTIYHKQVRKDRFAHRNFSSRDAGRMEHLSRELDLNPQQMEAIQAELAIVSREIKKLQAEMRPLFEKLHLQMREAIEKQLHAEQLAMFKEMTKHREEQRFRGGSFYRRGPDFRRDHHVRDDPRFNEDRNHIEPLQETDIPEKEE